MNLLFILPEFYPVMGGGICTYYQELFKQESFTATSASIVIQGSPMETRGGDAVCNGITVHYLEKKYYAKYQERFHHLGVFPEVQNYIAAAWAIYDQVAALHLKFDAVITTDWGLGFVPWILEKKVPVIVHLHGSIGQIDYYDPVPGKEIWSNLYLNLEADFLAQADGLVTHSGQNIRFWKGRLPAAKTISLIPPVVHSSEVNGTVYNAETNTGLVVARVQYWKGPIQLCEAVRLLSAKEKNTLRIYWVGGDSLYARAGSKMGDYLVKHYPDIWNKIILPQSEKTHEELQSYYQSCGFAIVPSTWDMFNLTAIEHLLNKRPLICSTGAGVADFLEERKGIQLFENNPEALAACIRSMIAKSPAELEKMGKDGFEYATERFDAGQTGSKHKEAIHSGIKNFSRNVDFAEKYNWLSGSVKYKEAKDPKKFITDGWSIKELSELLAQRILNKAGISLKKYR